MSGGSVNVKVMLTDPKVKKLIRDSVEEDLGPQDLTTDAIVHKGTPASADILAREDLVLAGIEVAREVFLYVDPRVSFSPRFPDGSPVRKGERIAGIEGEAAAILKAERVALNFLQHLSYFLQKWLSGQ